MWREIMCTGLEIVCGLNLKLDTNAIWLNWFLKGNTQPVLVAQAKRLTDPCLFQLLILFGVQSIMNLAESKTENEKLSQNQSSGAF